MSTTAGLVLFPGALGDFLCFLPALLALYERHAGLTLVANGWAGDLLEMPNLRLLSIHHRAMARLFAAEPGDEEAMVELGALLGRAEVVYTWSGHGNADVERRLAALTGATVRSFPFHGMRRGEHARDYYARCVGGLAASTNAAAVLRTDPPWLADFRNRHGLLPHGYLVVHAGSGSLRKNWMGFESFVHRWQQRRQEVVVAVRGPAEMERAMAAPGGVEVQAPTLAQLTSLLKEAKLYVGNDSGVSHLAASVGAPGLALFGSSDATTWAPRGSLRVVEAAERCERCEEGSFCVHRLPVEVVMERLGEVVGPARDGIGQATFV